MAAFALAEPTEPNARLEVARLGRDPALRRDLVRLAYAQLHDLASAEDCVQEALLSAHLRADQLRDAAGTAAWLKSIVVNACRMRARAERRQRRGGGARHLDVDELDAIVAAPPWQSPERQLLHAEQALRIEQALDAERAIDAAVFRSFVGREGSLADVARGETLTAQAIKTRVMRVRKRLRARLARGE
jgi:RNA polymerase sigma factor (sigma-70 family)